MYAKNVYFKHKMKQHNIYKIVLYLKHGRKFLDVTNDNCIDVFWLSVAKVFFFLIQGQTQLIPVSNKATRSNKLKVVHFTKGSTIYEAT